MTHPRAFTLCAAFVAGFTILVPSATAQPTPLTNAHAHNDYEHPRPLLDALDHGFCSVEADIYLVEGRLLVAHDRDKVAASRTLQALYLDPLREWIKRNGGRVYRNGPVVTLLVDIKSEAESTYSALRTVLNDYADILCSYSSGAAETKAVLVIISGNRPKKTMAAESERHAALDGRLEDLEGNAPSHLIPLISDNWTRLFKWRGVGPFPENEWRKLREIVAKTHAQGRKIRLWATPDRPEVWQELLASGADFINTDNLSELQAFLLNNDRQIPNR